MMTTNSAVYGKSSRPQYGLTDMKLKTSLRQQSRMMWRLWYAKRLIQVIGQKLGDLHMQILAQQQRTY